MAVIKLDYNKAINEANRLKTAADQLQALYNNSRNTTSAVKGYWEGASSNAFCAKNEAWAKEILSIKTELDSISATIKKVANDIREAERRAAAAMK